MTKGSIMLPFFPLLYLFCAFRAPALQHPHKMAARAIAGFSLLV